MTAVACCPTAAPVVATVSNTGSNARAQRLAVEADATVCRMTRFSRLACGALLGRFWLIIVDGAK